MALCIRWWHRISKRPYISSSQLGRHSAKFQILCRISYSLWQDNGKDYLVQIALMSLEIPVAAIQAPQYRKPCVQGQAELSPSNGSGGCTRIFALVCIHRSVGRRERRREKEGVKERRKERKGTR